LLERFSLRGAISKTIPGLVIAPRSFLPVRLLCMIHEFGRRDAA
jgi:hypothetical protein